MRTFFHAVVILGLVVCLEAVHAQDPAALPAPPVETTVPPAEAEPAGPTTLEDALSSYRETSPAPREIVFESDRWRITFTTLGAAFSSIRLFDFPEMTADLDELKHQLKHAQGDERKEIAGRIMRMETLRGRVDTLTRGIEEARKAGQTEAVTRLQGELREVQAIELIGEAKTAPQLALGPIELDSLLVYETESTGGRVESEEKVRFRASFSGNEIIKEYTLHPDSYAVTLHLTVTKAPGALNLSRWDEAYVLLWQPRVGYEKGQIVGQSPITYDVGGNVYSADKLQDKIADGKVRPDTPVNWAARVGRYFVAALIPEGKTYALWGDSQSVRVSKQADLIAIRFPGGNPEKAGIYLEQTVRIYAGPETLEDLKALGVGLEDLTYSGWTGSLGKIGNSVLVAAMKLTHSGGVAIILLTVLLRAATHPLNKKQMVTAEKMKHLQPKMKELQAKYKNDPQQLQQAVMKMYRDHKVNPLGGCLPILLTMPVFIALYYTVRSAIELRGESFLWIRDLTRPDTIAIIPLPFNLPFIGSMIPINPLPILYGAISVWQQSRMPMDPKQAQMMRLMPVIFLVIFYNFPSGVMLYMFVSSLLMVLAQIIHEKYGKKAEDIEVTTHVRSHSKSQNARAGN